MVGDGLGEGHVAAGEGGDGVVDLGFREAAHADHLGGQLVQFFLVGADDVLVHVVVLTRTGR